MHAPRSLSTFFAVWSLPLAGCAQDDPAPALPAGPALIYEDAYPAQELFDRPLFVAFHDTDPASAYVVTQPGRVFRIARDGTSGERELFLDLREKVILENWEEGLLGFQFDPAYADNGHVWVYWSEPIEARTEPMARGKRKSERQSVISRFTVADGDAA
jgi:hypothetical protein